MALSGEVLLPNGVNKKLTIEFKNNGIERYIVDGVLVEEINAVGQGKSNVRKIKIDGCDAELRYSFDGRETYADLYIDGEIYKKDIFNINPTLKATSSGKRNYGLLFFIFLLLIFLLYWLI